MDWFRTIDGNLEGNGTKVDHFTLQMGIFGKFFWKVSNYAA